MRSNAGNSKRKLAPRKTVDQRKLEQSGTEKGSTEDIRRKLALVLLE